MHHAPMRPRQWPATLAEIRRGHRRAVARGLNRHEARALSALVQLERGMP